MIHFLIVAAALQVATTAGANPAIALAPAPTCAPVYRVHNLPAADGDIVLLGEPHPTLTPLLDSLVQLWTPEYKIIDPPYSATSDSVFDHRMRELDRLWVLDSTRLLTALTTIIVDYTHYGLYFSQTASWNYNRLWGKPRPLLTNRATDWDYSNILVYFNALRPPLSADAQDVVLGFACDGAWQLQAVLRDSTYLHAYLYGDAIYWPRGALMIVDNARRRLLTGAHLQALEQAMQGTAGKL